MEGGQAQLDERRILGTNQPRQLLYRGSSVRWLPTATDTAVAVGDRAVDQPDAAAREAPDPLA